MLIVASNSAMTSATVLANPAASTKRSEGMNADGGALNRR